MPVDPVDAYNILVFGNITMFRALLEGIAALFSPGTIFVSDGGWGIGPAALAASMLAMLGAGIGWFHENRQQWHTVMYGVMIYAALFVPKVDVWLEDYYSGATVAVSNVPIGLVIPASVLSTLMISVTEAFQADLDQSDATGAGAGAIFTGGMNASGGFTGGFLSPLKLMLSFRGGIMGFVPEYTRYNVLNYLRDCPLRTARRHTDGLLVMAETFSWDEYMKQLNPLLYMTRSDLTENAYVHYMKQDGSSDYMGCHAFGALLRAPAGTYSLTNNLFGSDGLAKSALSRLMDGDGAYRSHLYSSAAAIADPVGDSWAQVNAQLTSLLASTAVDAQQFMLKALAHDLKIYAKDATSMSQEQLINYAMTMTNIKQNSRMTEAIEGESFLQWGMVAIIALQFLFIGSFPIIGIVTVAVGKRAFMYFGSYMMFGLWVYMIFPVATLINFFIQGSLIEGLYAIDIAGFDQYAYLMAQEQAQDMLTAGSNLLGLVPVATLVLITGNIFAMSSFASVAAPRGDVGGAVKQTTPALRDTPAVMSTESLWAQGVSGGTSATTGAGASLLGSMSFSNMASSSLVNSSGSAIAQAHSATVNGAYERARGLVDSATRGSGSGQSAEANNLHSMAHTSGIDAVMGKGSRQAFASSSTLSGLMDATFNPNLSLPDFRDKARKTAAAANKEADQIEGTQPQRALALRAGASLLESIAGTDEVATTAQNAYKTGATEGYSSGAGSQSAFTQEQKDALVRTAQQAVSANKSYQQSTTGTQQQSQTSEQAATAASGTSATAGTLYDIFNSRGDGSAASMSGKLPVWLSSANADHNGGARLGSEAFNKLSSDFADESASRRASPTYTSSGLSHTGAGHFASYLQTAEKLAGSYASQARKASDDAAELREQASQASSPEEAASLRAQAASKDTEAVTLGNMSQVMSDFLTTVASDAGLVAGDGPSLPTKSVRPMDASAAANTVAGVPGQIAAATRSAAQPIARPSRGAEGYQQLIEQAAGSIASVQSMLEVGSAEDGVIGAMGTGAALGERVGRELSSRGFASQPGESPAQTLARYAAQHGSGAANAVVASATSALAADIADRVDASAPPSSASDRPQDRIQSDGASAKLREVSTAFASLASMSPTDAAMDNHVAQTTTTPGQSGAVWDGSIDAEGVNGQVVETATGQSTAPGFSGNSFGDGFLTDDEFAQAVNDPSQLPSIMSGFNAAPGTTATLLPNRAAAEVGALAQTPGVTSREALIRTQAKFGERRGGSATPGLAAAVAGEVVTAGAQILTGPAGKAAATAVEKSGGTGMVTLGVVAVTEGYNAAKDVVEALQNDVGKEAYSDIHERTTDRLVSSGMSPDAASARATALVQEWSGVTLNQIAKHGDTPQIPRGNVEQAYSEFHQYMGH